MKMKTKRRVGTRSDRCSGRGRFSKKKLWFVLHTIKNMKFLATFVFPVWSSRLIPCTIPVNKKEKTRICFWFHDNTHCLSRPPFQTHCWIVLYPRLIWPTLFLHAPFPGRHENQSFIQRLFVSHILSEHVKLNLLLPVHLQSRGLAPSSPRAQWTRRTDRIHTY